MSKRKQTIKRQNNGKKKTENKMAKKNQKIQ
jgi:hypothetical protein